MAQVKLRNVRQPPIRRIAFTTPADERAALAEEMIEMHKARQAEMKGFLAWLEREIGAPVDGLTEKEIAVVEGQG